MRCINIARNLRPAAIVISCLFVGETAIGQDRIFHADFEQGLPPQITGGGQLESVAGYAGLCSSRACFSGMLLRNDTGEIGRAATPTRLRLDDLPRHEAIDVRFLLAVIDSWDGVQIDWTAPDFLIVRVDGQRVFLEALTNLGPPRFQNYEPPPGVAMTPLPPTVNLGWNIGHVDSAYDLGLEPRLLQIPHTASSVTIEILAGGNGWQGEMDESWGVDELEVWLWGTVPPRLTVTPTCPTGGPIRIEWSGATGGGQAALIFARNTGSFIIPNNYPCAGTQLGLGSNQIQLAWQGGAGPDGSRTLNASAGPGACGGHVQLLDLALCATSNVVRIE
ncbi:MAG: hypothetical protein KJZ69_16385 [Phycisphaerales bacterium]|nr:hypothetical protein [Phycisphaerales bacterium]